MRKSDVHKLSRSRLDKLINRYKAIDKETSELSNDFRHLSDEKWQKLFPSPSYWSLFYELDYLEHLYLFLYFIGLLDKFRKANNSEDPIESTLLLFDEMDASDDDSDINLPEGIPFPLFFICFYSITKSLKSWAVYGQTLSGLTKQVRADSYKALFKAVQIDPSYVSCPSAAHLISKALMTKKRGFSKKLGEAMRSNRGYYREELEPLRFILTAMTEAGDLQNMKHRERYDLFCEELRLYQADGLGDAYGSLKQFIYRWQQTAEVYGKGT